MAKVLGFMFSGFVAWWLWRTIYLSKLPRLEKKCRVALDWTLDLLFSKDLVQFGLEQLRPLRVLAHKGHLGHGLDGLDQGLALLGALVARGLHAGLDDV